MKRFFSVLVTVLIWLAVAFFLPRYGVLDLFFAAPVIEETEATPHIGFSTGQLFEDSHEVILTADEVQALPVHYDRYRSDLHYHTLTVKEQQVYRALEYAMETCQTNILVDSLLVKDVEHLGRILRSLAYDSPLLAQNLRYQTGTFTTYHDVEVLGLFDRSAEFDGYYITVENFEPQWWEKKQLAIEEAKKVVDGLDKDLSDIAKAEALYRHIADTVTYETYDDRTDVHAYLYDALVEGKTHCDGYANAMALLLRLAGIENAEKEFISTDKDNPGHTWNCMEIDGKWYNVDAVGEEYIPDRKSAMHAGYYFAFADELLQYEISNPEAFPVCEESYYMPVDGRFEKASDSGLSGAIVRGYDKHDDLWALVIIGDYQKSEAKSQLQKAANRLHDTIHYRAIELHGGSTALLVYDGSLYKD